MKQSCKFVVVNNWTIREQMLIKMVKKSDFLNVKNYSKVPFF